MDGVVPSAAAGNTAGGRHGSPAVPVGQRHTVHPGVMSAAGGSHASDDGGGPRAGEVDLVKDKHPGLVSEQVKLVVPPGEGDPGVVHLEHRVALLQRPAPPQHTRVSGGGGGAVRAPRKRPAGALALVGFVADAGGC